jgi:hypothetical protein
VLTTRLHKLEHDGAAARTDTESKTVELTETSAQADALQAHVDASEYADDKSRTAAHKELNSKLKKDKDEWVGAFTIQHYIQSAFITF